MHTVRRDGGEFGLVLLFKQTTSGCALGLYMYITILEFRFLDLGKCALELGNYLCLPSLSEFFSFFVFLSAVGLRLVRS